MPQYKMPKFAVLQLSGCAGCEVSLLNAEESLFESMEHLPFYTNINIGMESPDPETLDLLQKPLSGDKVKAAFSRMLDINRAYRNIEITANFVIGSGLPPGHFSAVSDLAASGKTGRYTTKGDIYLSPLMNDPALDELQHRFDERSDPDVRRLVHLVTSSGASPRAVRLFSDGGAGRGAGGGGCLLVPALIVGLVLAVGAAAHSLLPG